MQDDEKMTLITDIIVSHYLTKAQHEWAREFPYLNGLLSEKEKAFIDNFLSIYSKKFVNDSVTKMVE